MAAIDTDMLMLNAADGGGALNNAETVVLCSHVGRLNGQKDGKFSMAPITLVVAGKPGRDAKCLSDVSGQPAPSSGEV